MSAPPLFKSCGRPGYTDEVGSNPRRAVARKLEREVRVRFAREACIVQTTEGAIRARSGDAIVTAKNGDQWCVSQARFPDRYRPGGATRPGEDGEYTSVPNKVFAVPMSADFDVLLTDGESTLHGRAGDWLVDYGDGSLGVVSQHAFAETYEIVG